MDSSFEMEVETEGKLDVNGSPTEPMEVLMRDFYADAPSDNDLSGIENLMKQLFKHFNIDVKEFSKVLVGQTFLTTVLKEVVDEGPDAEEQDEDMVFCVFSVVSLSDKRDNPAVLQLIDFIRKESIGTPNEEIFRTVLKERSPYHSAFLIKEKIMNVPGIASCPLMQQLMNDMKEGTKNGMRYSFTHFIHISKMVRMANNVEYFVDQDDEIIHQNHICNLDLKLDSDPTTDIEVVFQDSTGKTIKGHAFKRIYVLTIKQLESYMFEMLKLQSVTGVMRQAGDTGLKCPS